jgi:hypothetical protein
MKIFLTALVITLLLPGNFAIGNDNEPDHVHVNIPGLDVYNRLDKRQIKGLKNLETTEEAVKIISFTLVVIDDEYRAIEIDSDSGTFTPEMKKALGQADESERLTLKNIKASFQGETVYLNPITFYVKE